MGGPKRERALFNKDAHHAGKVDSESVNAALLVQEANGHADPGGFAVVGVADGVLEGHLAGSAIRVGSQLVDVKLSNPVLLLLGLSKGEIEDPLDHGNSLAVIFLRNAEKNGLFLVHKQEQAQLHHTQN